MPDAAVHPATAADAGGAGRLARVEGFPTADGPIDVDVHRGEVILLAGPNGSGKTSLLRALAGLPAPRRPALAEVDGKDPGLLPALDLVRHVRFALQDPREGLVGLTVHGESVLRGMPLPTGLHSLADRDVAALSSGEARRVLLAMVASNGAPLLLLDEPTEGLDEAGRRRLLDLVADARRLGAVVAADHGPVLSGVATRTLTLGAPPATAATSPPPAGTAVIVDCPSCTVRRGDRDLRLPAVRLGAGVHALLGPNGSGKSTLLLRLAGMLDAQGVTIAGQAAVPGRSSRFLLPHAGDLFTAATVAGELAGHEDLGFVPAALRDRHPLALSAGEAQRVALAKVLGKPAPLYLLDEPEAHLDGEGRALLLSALARRAGEGACILAATHDASLAAWANGTVALEAP